jgi:DNA polymerase III delta prime subunit
MDSTLSISLRPRRLEDVIGHSRVVAALKKQLAEKRVSKGWIFSGPPGVGKTTLALILAEMINAPEGSEVTVLNAADANGVDATRELVETAEYHPLTGRYKVFILDEAQQLTTQAQNVLLKPLESEHGSAVFFFPTTEPAKLIPALRSRCLQFDLKPFTSGEIDLLMRRAVEKLGIQPIENFGELAVRSGVTGPREILMCLEKVAGGVPLREALFRPEHAPEYADVARKVLSGNWTATQEALQQIKTADIGGLRSVLAAFFRSSLLKGAPGKATDAIAEALIELGGAAPHEAGVAYAVLTAILYRLAQRIA